jgi:acetyltransferase
LTALDELLTFGSLKNPADVRGAGTRARMLPKVMEPFIRDEKFSILGILLSRPAVGNEDFETASTIIEISKTTNKPIFVVWIGRKIPDPGGSLDEQPYRILEKGGVPVFNNSKTCLKAIKHLIDYARFRERYSHSRR